MVDLVQTLQELNALGEGFVSLSGMVVARSPSPDLATGEGPQVWVDEKLVLTGSEAPAGPLAHRPRRFWP